MIKEILDENNIEESVDIDDIFKKAMSDMKDINTLIDKAIKNKDKKALDNLVKDLAKIKK